MGSSALIEGFHRSTADAKKTIFGVRDTVQTQEVPVLKYIPVVDGTDFIYHCYAVPGTDLFAPRWLIAREWVAAGTLPVGSFDFAEGGNDYFNNIAEGVEVAPNLTTLQAYTYS